VTGPACPIAGRRRTLDGRTRSSQLPAGSYRGAVDVLELFNSEMGAFRVRLLRKGEPYGLMHQLTFDDDEPAVEFYGPAVEGEQLRDTTPIGRNRVSGLLRPRDEWRTLGPDGYCSISPENSREIAGWLARELERPWVPPPPPPPPRSQARANRPVELNETGDRRVTFYVRGGIGYTRKEAQWVRVYRRPHAQYADAIFVDFLARGKRRPRRIVLTYKPSIVILLGWDHPELQELLVAHDGPPFRQPNSSATAFTTKYTIPDPRYDQEFESALDAYLTSLPLIQLLLDLRGATVTMTSHVPGSAQRSDVPVFERSGVRPAGTRCRQR